MFRLVAVCCLIACAGVASAAPSVREAAGKIVFGNDLLELQFDQATGAWVGLSEGPGGGNLIGHCPLRAPVDFESNGQNVCSANAPAPTSGDSRDLAGKWLFRVDPNAVGDKKGWPKGLPEVDIPEVPGARMLVVPGYWEAQGVTDVFPNSPDPTWVPYNGDAWYQRDVDVPAEWAGADLQFSAGGMDDFDWVYFNGELIGHTGQDTPDWWAARRLYSIPAKLVRFGAKNRLVVHVHDRGGDGGIVGHVMIGKRGKLPETSRWEPCGLKYVSHSLSDNTLAIVTRAGDWQVTMTYELIAGRAVVRRTMKLKWEGQGPTRIGTTQWLVPGVRIGEAEDCEIRGPQWGQPVTRFASASPPQPTATSPPGPLSTNGEGETATSTAPAVPAFSGVGTMHADDVWGGGAWSAVYNRKLKSAVVVSFIARTEGFSGWAREGEGEASLGSNLSTADTTKPGQEYDLGTQYVSLRHGEWGECLSAVKEMYRLHGFVARPTAPEWAKRAIIYTMYPGGTMESGLQDTGGFNNVTKYTLPRIKELGCNTLWFLPVCPGLYGPKDYYAIEPAIGTEADLHTCVAAAKTQGINVLLDLVPHGPDVVNPIAKEHPDWVGKDEKGQPALWWGCTYCDYANPGWQKYMADVARYFVEKDGIKGWRVDCAPGGPANWDPNRKVRASMSSMYGGLEVLKAAKESMRQVDKEVVLLPEGTGPMLLENADIVYDYNMYFGIFKHYMDAESPEAWRQQTAMWLEQQRLSWPEGGCFGLMRFLENHDNVRYWRYAGVGPARALMAMCAWIQGVPLYHHLQEVGSSEEFTRINSLRKQVEELNTGTARYLAAKADKPGIFTCLREDGEKKALVVINLTGEAVATTISLPEDALPKGERLVAYEAWRGLYLNAGKEAGCAREELRQVKVRLAPYEPALVLLRPAGAAPPRVAERVIVGSEGAPKVLTVEKTPDGARIASGEMRLEISAARGGLPTGIAVGDVGLLQSLNVTEGRAKPFGPGAALNLAGAGPARVSVDTARKTVTAEGEIVRGSLGGEKIRMPYRLTYEADAADSVNVTFAFQAPQTLRRTSGSLNVELAFANADWWQVNTIEGTVQDAVTRFHPVPGDYTSGWLQHVVGDRLWEERTLPMNELDPTIWVGARSKMAWLGVDRIWTRGDLPIDNVYLRETRGADRKELGPTLVIAWMDSRAPRDLAAGKWCELHFDLITYPGVFMYKMMTSGIRADGGNYVLENSHYRLIVGKSGGGVIRSFESKKTGWRAITGSDTYTDNGFYEKANNEGGQFGSAADWPDLDPEVAIRNDGGKTILEITGKLHGSNWNWAFAASPAIAYRKTFTFDQSDTVHCEVAVRPFAKTQMKGFLAHRLMLSAMAEWMATGQSAGETETLRVSPPAPRAPVVFSGQPGGPNTRTWQSKASSFRDKDGALAFTAARVGTGVLARPGDEESLLLSHINMSPKPQNVFIHQNGQSPNLFLAWYDSDSVDVAAEWHTLSYDLQIVPGGAEAAKKIVSP